MKDITKMLGLDCQAEGRVCINYTDPITQKIKEQIKGKNHIYRDALFSGWYSNVTNATMVLSMGTRAIDPDIPYILGDTIGYGMPLTGSLGTVRGAYNAASSYLELKTLENISWKFVYDFTPMQVPYPVKTIAMTNQFSTKGGSHFSKFGLITGSAAGNGGCTSDGRYTYRINADGIITKYDAYFNTTTTIDIVGIVGAVFNKILLYEPLTGYYYVWSASKKMFRFDDDTFSVSTAEWLCPNLALNLNGGLGDVGGYVYNGIAYVFNGTNIYKLPFVANIAQPNVPLPPTSTIGIPQSTSVTTFSSSQNSITSTQSPLKDTLIVFGGGTAGSSTIIGYIWDLATESVVGYLSNSSNAVSSKIPSFIMPTATNKILGLVNDQGNVNCAIAQYVLPVDAPERPAGYGMTVSYEIEVTW
jgi:hypothetical protein